MADASETATDDLTFTIYDTLSTGLTDMSVSPGILTPAFHNNTVVYSVAAAATVTSLDITAQTADPAATLTINNHDAVSNVAQSVYLKQEANLIPVVVTSPDGLSQKSYVVSVNGMISNSDLYGLTINGQILNPVFDPATQSYTLTVGNGVGSLEITATPSDPRALMVLDGSLLPAATPTSIDLPVGDTELRLMVVAQDASTKTYTINITRQASLSIDSSALTAGVLNIPYTFVLQGSGGSTPYNWSATELPDWLSLDAEDGVLAGTPIQTGSSTFTIHLQENGGGSTSQDFTVDVREGTSNGAYTVTPVADPDYTAGLTSDGIPAMTVNSGITGFKYFSVNVEPVTGRSGNEVMVFVQIRNGQQIGISATRADFEDIKNFP